MPSDVLTVKLGATRDGLLKADEMTYLIDSGAYTDTGPIMALLPPGGVHPRWLG